MDWEVVVGRGWGPSVGCCPVANESPVVGFCRAVIYGSDKCIANEGKKSTEAFLEPLTCLYLFFSPPTDQ